MKILVALALIMIVASFVSLVAANGGNELAREILNFTGPLAIVSGFVVFVGRVAAHLYSRSSKNPNKDNH
jgi:NADH:ubiquinone oxidoreductase subunit 2 (subunit N)